MPVGACTKAVVHCSIADFCRRARLDVSVVLCAKYALMRLWLFSALLDIVEIEFFSWPSLSSSLLSAAAATVVNLSLVHRQNRSSPFLSFYLLQLRAQGRIQDFLALP